MIEEQSLQHKKFIKCIGDGVMTGLGNLVDSNTGTMDFHAVHQDCHKSMMSLYGKQNGYQVRYTGGAGFGLTSTHLNSRTIMSFYEEIITYDALLIQNRKPEKIFINIGTSDFLEGYDFEVVFEGYAALVLKICEMWEGVEIINLVGPVLNDHYPENMELKSRMVNLIEQIVFRAQNFGLYNLQVVTMENQSGELGYGEFWYPTVRQHEKSAGELNELIKMKTD